MKIYNHIYDFDCKIENSYYKSVVVPFGWQLLIKQIEAPSNIIKYLSFSFKYRYQTFTLNHVLLASQKILFKV